MLKLRKLGLSECLREMGKLSNIPIDPYMILFEDDLAHLAPLHFGMSNLTQKVSTDTLEAGRMALDAQNLSSEQIDTMIKVPWLLSGRERFDTNMLTCCDLHRILYCTCFTNLVPYCN